MWMINNKPQTICYSRVRLKQFLNKFLSKAFILIVSFILFSFVVEKSCNGDKIFYDTQGNNHLLGKKGEKKQIISWSNWLVFLLLKFDPVFFKINMNTYEGQKGTVKMGNPVCLFLGCQFWLHLQLCCLRKESTWGLASQRSGKI